MDIFEALRKLNESSPAMHDFKGLSIVDAEPNLTRSELYKLYELNRFCDRSWPVFARTKQQDGRTLCVVCKNGLTEKQSDILYKVLEEYNLRIESATRPDLIGFSGDKEDVKEAMEKLNTEFARYRRNK